MGNKDSANAETRQKIAVAIAASLGIAGCVTVFTIATRTGNAAETAKVSSQGRYAENLQTFSDGFNANIGGTPNGVAFALFCVAAALAYFVVEDAPNSTAVRFFVSIFAAIYTMTLSIYVLSACMDTSGLDNCGDTVANDANPYTSCRIQEDIKQEIDTLMCPSIYVYAAISTSAWALVCIGKGFDWYYQSRSSSKYRQLRLNPEPFDRPNQTRTTRSRLFFI